jgi:CubicO group peptidase (beta-lactamase class C family)
MRAIRNAVYVAALMVSLPASAKPDFTPLRGLLERAIVEGVVAGGSILVLHRGEVVFQEGFGFANLKTREAFELDTPVVIASISKPLLGTAAFRLAEHGDLDLSSPISKVIPEFGKSEVESGDALVRAPNTLELFTHTSGMRNDDAPGGRPWFASWTKGKSLESVVKHIALEIPFKAQPGSRYAYSGIGTDVAARVLEIAAKQSRNDLFVAEVSDPLGMTRTLYRDVASVGLIGDMPTRYYRGKDGTLQVSRERPLPAQGEYSASGGTILSTAVDLSRWLLMIRNGGRHEGSAYLAPETVAKMLASYPRSSKVRGGLAIRKRDRKGEALVVGHTGSSGTNCWIDFEHDIIGIVLTQTRGKHIRPFRIELEKSIRECIAGQGEAGAQLPKS